MPNGLVSIVNPAGAVINQNGIIATVGDPGAPTVAFVPTEPVPGSLWYYQDQPYSDASKVPNPNDGDTFVYTDNWAVFAFYDGAWIYQGTLQGPSGTPITTSYLLDNVSSWSTSHNYPYMPAVRLIDASTSADVAASIDYPSATTVHITFPEPWTGTVYLT